MASMASLFIGMTIEISNTLIVCCGLAVTDSGGQDCTRLIWWPKSLPDVDLLTTLWPIGFPRILGLFMI